MSGYIGVVQDLGSNDNVKGQFNIQGFYIVRQILTPTSVSANSTSEQTFTVQGVQVGDSIDINKASHQTGLGITNVRASAANTLAITYMNNTASPITPTSEQYIIGGMR